MRLILKSDFDGVISAMLFRSIRSVDEVVFVHPEDILRGEFKLLETDCVINLPILNPVAEHYTVSSYPFSEEGVPSSEYNYGDQSYYSCASQLIKHYPDLENNPEAMAWVQCIDRFNRGELSIDEVLKPDDYLIIGFLMDPLTGIGKRRDFLKSNYYFLLDFIENGFRNSIGEDLQPYGIEDRVLSYKDELEAYSQFIRREGVLKGDVLLLDKRLDSLIPIGNRFQAFIEYPQVRTVIYIQKSHRDPIVALSVVASPFFASEEHLGQLLLPWGGYGDQRFASVQIPYDQVEEVVDALGAILNERADT